MSDTNAATTQPQTKPHRVRAILESKTDDTVVLALPQTDYRLHLKTLSAIPSDPGDRVVGTIRIKAAKRFDVVKTGGRYIEPLMGQPRRIQGDIVAIDTANNTMTVNCVTPVVVSIASVQKASDFEVGRFVAGDVKSDAMFSLAGD